MFVKQIYIQQFVEKLSIIIGCPIWRVIHPADGWLFFDLGKQYQDFFYDKDGSQKPYTKGEYQLYIQGDWVVTQGEKIIEARATKPDESQQKYFTRMESLARDFSIKVFSNVRISEGYLVFEAENGFQLKVPITGKDDALSFTMVELSAHNKPVTHTHFRFDEELSSLAEVSSDLVL